MIGKARIGSGFGGLQGYLLKGGERGLQDYLMLGSTTEEAHRVAWTSTRNLPFDDPHRAGAVMSVTAEQNRRVKKPVYHLSLAAHPGDELSRERWEAIVDRVLGDLGLEEHQVLVVAHGDKEHPHVHLMVNRVHPKTLKTWHNGHDYFRIEKSLRHVERDFGLRRVHGRHYQLEGQERAERRRQTSGERRQAERTGEESWGQQVRFRTYELFKGAESWAELERGLASHGLRLERRGGGLVVTDGSRRVKASRIYRRGSYSWLEKRFGMSFEAWRDGRRQLVEAVDRYEKVERERRELQRIEHQAQDQLKDARSKIRRRRRIRDASRRAARKLESALDGLYRTDEVPSARRRLVARARDIGWDRAARELADHPRRFGKLRRRPVVRHHHVPGRLSRRRRRSILIKRLLSAAKDIAVLRSARAVAGPPGFKAAYSAVFARRTLQRAHRRRRGLPSSKTLLKEIAGRALALGFSAVRLAMAPRPLAVVRTAVRSAQLARAVARGMER